MLNTVFKSVAGLVAKHRRHAVAGVALAGASAIPASALAEQSTQFYMPEDVTAFIEGTYNINVHRDLEFTPTDLTALDRPICYDGGFNGIQPTEADGIADREIRFEYFDAQGKRAFEYGDIAVKGNDHVGLLQLNTRPNMSDTPITSERELVNHMRAEMQRHNTNTAVMIVYDWPQSNAAGQYVPSHIFSILNDQLTVATFPGYSPLTSPNEKFCDQLQMPAEVPVPERIRAYQGPSNG